MYLPMNKGILRLWTACNGLSTIRDFVLGQEYLESREEHLRGQGFRLKDLEFWTKYNFQTFQELPVLLQNRILETEFSFTIINPGTPEEVKRNIFKRINTGGEPLSAQEIRNALYLGRSTKLLKKLANTPEFLKATAGSVRSNRMEDQELVLRFVSFFIRNYSTYRRTIGIDQYLSETMIILNAHPEYQSRDFLKLVEQQKINIPDINKQEIPYIEEYFRLGMKRAYEIFGRHCFRKSYGHRRRSPINKALFEMWGVLLSRLSENSFLNLSRHKNDLFEAYHSLVDYYGFERLISRDSMKSYAVEKRFSEINGLISQFSNG